MEDVIARTSDLLQGAYRAQASLGQAPRLAPRAGVPPLLRLAGPGLVHVRHDPGWGPPSGR
eukprot:8107213-Alexandrium_andersonii.AAC.1